MAGSEVIEELKCGSAVGERERHARVNVRVTRGACVEGMEGVWMQVCRTRGVYGMDGRVKH